jgi:hypothetical protein
MHNDVCESFAKFGKRKFWKAERSAARIMVKKQHDSTFSEGPTAVCHKTFYLVKKILLLTGFSLCIGKIVAQTKIDTTGQVAFIYYEKLKANLIVIPNLDKLYSFKLYRKVREDSLYQEIAELKKPALPERRYGTQYSVGWPDKGVHSRNVDYKVIAFDKNGGRICELHVFWEKSPNKDSLKAN